MAKATHTNRKTRVCITPPEVISLQTDYRNGVGRERIQKKYKISQGSYYKYVKAERERMLRAALDGKREASNEAHVNVMSAGAYGIAYNELAMKSGNYLKGMSITFGVTEAEILDDLVNLALDLGAMEIHGKK